MVWKVLSQITSISNLLGIKNVSRKCRKSSSNPDTWVGTDISIEDRKVYVLTSEEKSNKEKVLFDTILTMIQESTNCLYWKSLEFFEIH